MPDEAGPRLSEAAAQPLRVAFAGTPEFAALFLRAIHAAGHAVPLVLTQPDRPAGRGLKLQPSAVKQSARALGLPLEQPRSLRLDGAFAAEAAAAESALRRAAPDVLVVAAYGLILPGWVLDLPRFGCLNIHASLLPRWRGAAPIQRAIEAGDTHSGITLMQMDAGLDTGAMLLRETVCIAPGETAASLHDRLAPLGARLVLQGLTDLQAGRLRGTAQPESGVTYARKIDKVESAIDWQAGAELIERRLRAFDPFPGCTSLLGGQTVKLWRGRVVPGQGAPGQWLPSGPGRLVTACGEGALEWLQVQLPGGRRMDVAELLQRQPDLASSPQGAGR
ncbi:MAG: methionyl-tRNA formyltransferase [Chitinophagaceae bacterium]|nr:methionyl-tRNA formyltransferase [Rubrivivax sp.]